MRTCSSRFACSSTSMRISSTAIGNWSSRSSPTRWRFGRRSRRKLTAQCHHYLPQHRPRSRARRRRVMMRTKPCLFCAWFAIQLPIMSQRIHPHHLRPPRQLPQPALPRAASRAAIIRSGIIPLRPRIRHPRSSRRHPCRGRRPQETSLDIEREFTLTVMTS